MKQEIANDVALIDAGGANLGSVRYALERLGVDARIVRDADGLRGAQRVILPGVGAAPLAMQLLRERGFDVALRALEVPLIGICLGMQLLFEASAEGDVACLGLLPGTVRRMQGSAGLRVPHMGWNTLDTVRKSVLLDGIEQPAHAYFVHGYAAPVTNDCIASCTHGEPFAACVERGRIAGMQFHPERSADVGSKLLANFWAGHLYENPCMTALLYPAIDVREGRVVRLQQGDYARETRYADDPFELALRYAAHGATWLHLVDLDAAREGGYAQLDLLSRIKAATSLKVQTGGGLRDEAGVDALFAAGVDRVVVGSLAIREPERVKGWLAHYGAERITLALDASCNPEGEWQLPSHGWTRASGASLFTLLEEYLDAGARHVLCTDIARDGMLAGPALALYAQLLARAPQVQLQASGGIRSVDDICEAATLGCAGVVLGKALLDGRFTLPEALDGVASC